MTNYRPKSNNTINAFEVTNESANRIAHLFGGRVVQETTLEGEELSGINVPTLEGVIRASHGEFVVMEPDGTVKVYGPSRFHELYEENRP